MQVESKFAFSFKSAYLLQYCGNLNEPSTKMDRSNLVYIDTVQCVTACAAIRMSQVPKMDRFSTLITRLKAIRFNSASTMCNSMFKFNDIDDATPKTSQTVLQEFFDAQSFAPPTSQSSTVDSNVDLTPGSNRFRTN